MDPWAPANVSYEDYVAMCGCPPVMGIEGMLAHYKLTMAQWTQIAGYWTGIIATNPQYMQHGLRVEQEAARIRGGGPPRPLSIGAPNAAAAAESSTLAVSGAMPGAVPPPGYGAQPAVSGAMPGAVPPPGYGASPAAATGFAPSQAYGGPPQGYAAQPQPAYGPQPGYSQSAYPPPPQPGYPQQQPGYPQQPQQPPQGWPQQAPQQAYRPAYNNPQAAAIGNEVGNAFSALGNALGSVVNSVVGTFSHGQSVMVQWSDGNRYPAKVLIQQSGQVQVVFPDGRQVWVPQGYVVVC
jgi:hypothetical protein